MKEARATHPEVEEATQLALASGNAVDAVVSGVFAAASVYPATLLGPLVLVYGGPGAGLFAVDGRPRQPGRGALRPRGFLRDEAVPDAAYAGAPTLVAAAATALASAGKHGLAWALRPALKRALSTSRKNVLSSMVRLGPRVMEASPLSEALLRVVGRAEHGLLTEEDLTGLETPVVPCKAHEHADKFLQMPPWDMTEGGTADAEVGVALACDGRGLFAAALFLVEVAEVSARIGDLDVPRLAEPVMRGIPRVKPGTPLGCPSAVGLVTCNGRVEAAIGSTDVSSDADELYRAWVKRKGRLVLTR